MYLRKIPSFARLAALVLCCVAYAAAQTQDNSQNGLLNGTFKFRHVAVQLVDSNFNPSDITASYGTITFNGAGSYTIAGTSIDPSVSGGAPTALNVTATYAIGSNGLGYLTNPLYPTDTNAFIYGAVSQGVFTGSSTESQDDQNTLNDIFIAIPVGTAPTNASYTSSYQTGLLDFTTPGSAAIKNALFELNPNGQGTYGTITLNGQAGNQTDSQGNVLAVNQTVSGATYTFPGDGSISLTIPLPSGVTSADALFANGTKTMFQSADGNFVLGWTTSGYDVFFGVKALTVPETNLTSGGLYFTSALEDSPSVFGTDSYYGSTKLFGDSNGDGIVHQRVNVPSGLSFDFGTDDQLSFTLATNSNGSVGPDFNGYDYFFGDGGKAWVAIGTSGFFSLQVGLQAPTYSGPGVYLYPTGVVNAASYQPITASLAPGELISLFGTGLAPTATSALGSSLPTSLGGVSVTIDNIACPIAYAGPNQINAVVPYEVAQNQTGLANIQVTNNKVMSNVVQMYLTDANPGSFSQTGDGIGLAAAEHAATGEFLTTTNPAQPGEYISLYLSGLGTVTPAITDGTLAPSSPLSYSDLYNAGNLAVYLFDYNNVYNLSGTPTAATVQFAGLAPGFAGLYQVNVQVPPSGLGAGDDVYIEFVTDAAQVNQIQFPYELPTGTRLSTTGRPAGRAMAIKARRSLGTKSAARRDSRRAVPVE